jgi:hypothetical protein
MRSNDYMISLAERCFTSQVLQTIACREDLLWWPRRWRRTCTGTGGGCRTTTATTSTCGRGPSPSSGSAVPRPTCEPLPVSLQRTLKPVLCCSGFVLRRCQMFTLTAAATMRWTGGWRRAAATRPASCGRATARPSSGPAPCPTGRCWTRPAAWCAASCLVVMQCSMCSCQASIRADALRRRLLHTAGLLSCRPTG